MAIEVFLTLTPAGSSGSFHGNAEVFPQGGKSLYVSRSSSVLSVNRPPFLEQRVGPPYNVPSDVHMQGTYIINLMCVGGHKLYVCSSVCL